VVPSSGGARAEPAVVRNGTYETVKARFRPWLEPFLLLKSLKPFNLFVSKMFSPQAARVLNLPSFGYAYLLDTFCGEQVLIAIPLYGTYETVTTSFWHI